MDTNKLLSHEKALAHTTTQSAPTPRALHSLGRECHPSHTSPEGVMEGLTVAEARGTDRFYEHDKVHVQRRKTDGSATQLLQKAIVTGKLTKSHFDNQVKGVSKAVQKHGRIGEAFRKEPNLQSQIISATVLSDHPEYRNRIFLPRNEIPRLLTLEAVEKELARCDRWRSSTIFLLLRPRVPNFQREAKIICGIGNSKSRSNSGCIRYQKIFIILVLLKRASLIISFLEQEVCDDDLPLALGNQVDTAILTIKTKGGREVYLRGFRRKKSFYDKFIEKQWVVLSPYFQPCSPKKDTVQTLYTYQIPPFTSWSLASTKGGFSEVIKVEIHADHHGFRTRRDVPPVFAIKRINHGPSIHEPRSDSQNEALILRKLKDSHPHLISLLATYYHHGACHFIFPWADADLYGYWKDIRPAPFDADRDKILVWLGTQCKGLAEGLSTIHCYRTDSFSLQDRFTPPPGSKRVVRNGSENEIHELFGRHGDIKPENILWFPKESSSLETWGGILKITDFGFTEFSTKAEVDKARRGFIVHSLSYRAPEIDLSSGNGLIDPSYDIWALGCIYLEFLAWWLGGWDYVHSFAKRRLGHDLIFWGGRKEGHRTDAFFSIIQYEETGKDRAEVRKSVIEFMNEVHNHMDSNNLIRDFLQLIRAEMLVVKSQDQKRSSAENISISLDIMLLAHRLGTGFP